LLFMVFLFTSLTRSYFEYQKNIMFYKSYRESYENEKKKNITLKTEVLKQGDPYEIEKTIRNKLNLLKENEVALIIPEPSPTPTPIITPSVPVYKQWWNVFFKP
jgi:hypothetical protein